MDENKITRLENAIKKIHVKTVAPVHLWNPKYCGDLDIRILRDGSWLYQGSKINRLNLIKLFSSILKRENDKFFLVTPVEKIGIKVRQLNILSVINFGKFFLINERILWIVGMVRQQFIYILILIVINFMPGICWRLSENRRWGMCCRWTFPARTRPM